MKTLLFCTGYSTSDLEWEKRWRRWYNHHKQVGLQFDQLLIVDDGSPELPGWSDTRVIYDLDRPWFANKDIVIYRYEDNLGIDGGAFSVPGLYRGFQTASRYMQEYGFDKLLNIESDSYILSKRMIEYINNIDKSWTAFWEPKFKVPELGINIAAGAGLTKWFNTTNKNYSEYNGLMLETEFDFDHVEKGFVGERYGERCQVLPSGIDYACQIGQDWDDIYTKHLDKKRNYTYNRT